MRERVRAVRRARNEARRTSGPHRAKIRVSRLKHANLSQLEQRVASLVIVFVVVVVVVDILPNCVCVCVCVSKLVREPIARVSIVMPLEVMSVIDYFSPTQTQL